ncbi:hypothetical protein ACWCW7_17740 [Nocardia tengchongensis]
MSVAEIRARIHAERAIGGALCSGCGDPLIDRLSLCVKCGDAIVARLLELPGVVADLAVARARLDRLHIASGGGKSAESPMPVRATSRGREMVGEKTLVRLENTVTDLAHDIAKAVRTDLPFDDPTLVRLVHGHRDTGANDPAALSLTGATRLEQAAVWLACHQDALRDHAQAGILLAELSNGLTRLRSSIDRRADGRYMGPCPAVLDDGSECGHELRVDRGSRSLVCRRCQTHHDVASIEARVRERAEDQLWPLADLLRILTQIGSPVSRSTLYRWAREGVIEPRGWRHGTGISEERIAAGDVQVYRLGDVISTAARGSTKTADPMRGAGRTYVLS